MVEMEVEAEEDHSIQEEEHKGESNACESETEEEDHNCRQHFPCHMQAHNEDKPSPEIVKVFLTHLLCHGFNFNKSWTLTNFKCCNC